MKTKRLAQNRSLKARIRLLSLVGLCALTLPLLAVQITDEAEIAALGEDLTHPQTALPAGENIFADGKTVFISLDSGLSNAFDNASLYKPAEAWPSRSMCAKGKSYLGIGYTFATPKKIVAYSVSIGQLKWARGRRAPKTFTLFGTNDDPLAEDATWDNLGTGENNGYEKVTNWIDDTDETATKAPETRYFRCQEGAPLGYKSFKWVATAPVDSADGYIHVSELEFFGTDVNASDLPALAVSADVPDWVKESKPEAFAKRATLDAGSVTIPVPAEFHDEESGTSRYRRVGYVVEAYNPQTSAYDRPVAMTPSADGDSFSFAYEAGGRYLLTWLFDHEHLVRCAALDGLGTVFVDGAGDDSPAEAWVKEGEIAEWTATPDDAHVFLYWKDAEGKIYKGSSVEIKVTGPMELTAHFWEKDLPFVLYVKMASDGGDDANDGLSPETAKATINAALAEIPVSVNARIHVFPGTYKESATCVIEKPVEIIGAGPHEGGTVIRRRGTSGLLQSGGFNIDERVMIVSNSSARVSNLAIENGFTGIATRTNGGAGACIFYGTISNCVVRNCMARQDSNSQPMGGGVYLLNDDALLTHCVVTNCGTSFDADWAGKCVGGVYVQKGCVRETLVQNCFQVSSKPTNGKISGGIHVNGGRAVNCSVIDCWGSNVGGIYIDASGTATNCVVFGCQKKLYNSTTETVDVTRSAIGGSTAKAISCVSEDDGLTAGDFIAYATGNYLPMKGGRLYDAGCAVGDAPAVDLLGNDRVYGAGIDVGACEGYEIVTFTVVGDPADYGASSLAWGAHMDLSGTQTVSVQEEWVSDDGKLKAVAAGWTLYVHENDAWVVSRTGEGFTATFDVPAASARLQWHFDVYRSLTIETLGGGSVEAPSWVLDGATFTAVPTAAEGYKFLGWVDERDWIVENINAQTVNEARTFRALFIPSEATEPVQYVSTDGDDEADGFTRATAKKTIPAAVEFVDLYGDFGGVVYVAPGHYAYDGKNTDAVYLTTPIRIVGEISGTEPGEVVFSRKSGSGRAFRLNNADALVCNLVVSNAFANWNAPNGSSGTSFSILAGGGTVSNCVVTAGSCVAGLYGAAGTVYADGKNALVTHTVVSDSKVDHEAAETGLKGCGIHLVGGARAENCLVTNCTTAAKAPGVNNGVLYPKSVGGIFASKGCVVVNCTVADCAGLYSGGIHAQETAVVTNCVVYNCSYVATNAAGTVVWVKTLEEAYKNVASRVDLSGTASRFVNCAGDMETPVNDQCLGGLTAADFKDYANGNFMPKAGGLLYNKGASVTLASALDLAGNPRVQGSKIDIGAFEAPPSGLRILIR